MTFLPSIFHERCYSPDDLAMMQDVYSSVAQEPWFTKDPDKRQAFAAEVFRMFDRGLVLPDKLQQFCHILAERRFADGPAANVVDQTGSR